MNEGVAEGAYCEWPPTPPIGQLSPEVLTGTAENLANLLQNRFGLTENETIKKPPAAPLVWNRARLLQLSIMCLEGWGKNRIADYFAMTSEDADAVFSEKTVGVAATKHCSRTVHSLSKIVREKISKWHAILHPTNSTTERRIQSIERRLALSRAQIFTYAGFLPNVRGSGMYDTDTAISILHDKIIHGLTQNQVGDRLGLRVGGRNQPKGNAVHVLTHKLLSPEAKRASRISRGFSAGDADVRSGQKLPEKTAQGLPDVA